MNNDIFEEIGKGVQWYFDNAHKANINLLIEFQDKISGYAYWLAEVAADQKKDYNAKYFSRKIEVAKSKQGLINKSMAVNKADNQSLVENEDIMKAELESEAYAYKCDLLLRQTNKMLESVRQRISFMKQEFENVKK